MGGGTRIALIALAAALVRPAVAQNPPAAPPAPPASQDTTRRDSTAQDTSGIARLLFTDYIGAGSGIVPRVQLTKGMVYKIEVDPGAALEVRSALHPRQPPLLLLPLQTGTILGTWGYLVVPTSTEDYLIDVASAEGIPGNTVRIYFDPKESARYNRIKAEGFRAPLLSFGVSAVYAPPFRDASSSYLAEAQAAYGLRMCVGVLANGRLLPDRVGGCAVSLTLWKRSAGRSFFTVGMEPEVVIRRRPLLEVSIVPQVAFGNTTGGEPYATYALYGLGVRFSAALAGDPHIGLAGQANVEDLASHVNGATLHRLFPSIGAGVIFKL